MHTRALSVVFAACAALSQGYTLQAFDAQMPMTGEPPADTKVPVLLGVMSACPDALVCESVFNQMLPKVEGKIDLALTYVDWYGLSI